MTKLKRQRFAKRTKERVVIDCAGAKKGGAARFLRELENYIAEYYQPNVELIGQGKQLTPQWLVRRELLAASATRRISLNNAGFLNPKGENITLLRNILQFATQRDLETLAFIPPRRLRIQSPIVRTLARMSETLVVPCTRMADQVVGISPGLRGQLAVRFHPVSQPEWAGTMPKDPYDVLLPIVPSPYKNLNQHIPEFLNASEQLFENPVRLIVPSTPDVLPEIGSHPRVKYIGPQTSEELEQYWRNCAAVFFPVEFEAFGYPLAESRVYGRYVIAQDTSQNHEIAGLALKPYQRESRTSLREAIRQAMSDSPSPDGHSFSPIAYFQWLLEGAERT